MNVYYTGNGCFMTADELYHYGVKGMKWGKRKAQQYEARAQRNRTMASMNRAAANRSSGLTKKLNTVNANYYQKRADKLSAKAQAQANRNSPEAKAARKAKAVKAAKIGAAVAGTALAAYGAYKVSSIIKDKASSKSYEAGKAAMNRWMAAAKHAGKAGDWNKSTIHYQTAREVARRADERTNRVKNSTVEAAKYLWRTRGT